MTREPDTQPSIRGDASTAPAAESAREVAAESAREVPLGLDRYAIGPVLGRGGMGEVRSARDTVIGRDIAIKALRGDVGRDDDLRARFLREAHVQARLDHPAIVPIYDLGSDRDGLPYFAMKRLSGATLAEILRERSDRWSRRALLAKLVEVCQAVEFAHRRGVVHRDLKPANIMLGELGEVYVLDWGIARVAGTPDLARGEAAAAGGDTAPGAILGTLGYMPPEQVRGDTIDHRADVYALGCILFEMLAGAPALPRGPDAYLATLEAKPHRPSRVIGDVPPELDDLCAAATQPDPAARLASAAALAEGIQRYLDGDRDLERRRELAGEHAAIARRAFELADHATAMREAGAALALDPAHADALAIVSRILLEPPARPPEAVLRRVEQERAASAKVQIRIVGIAYSLNILMLPLLAWWRVTAAWAIVAIVVGVIANVAVFARYLRSARPPESLIYLGLLVHAAVLVLSAGVFSPLVVLPGNALMSIVAFMSYPTMRRPVLATAALVTATLAPFALEALHVLPHSMTVTSSGVTIRPWALAIPGTSLVILAVATTLAQLVGTAYLIARMRRAQEAAQLGVHQQAWHLSQLLPEAG